LRAVTLVAADKDPEPATGLQVTIQRAQRTPWPLPEVAEPALAEGPGADPGAALEGWRYEPGRIHALEDERFTRFQHWLGGQDLSKAARAAAVRNGRCWGNYLVVCDLPAGAVTEYDLRMFVYGFYPLVAKTTETAARDLPRSIALLFQFLEAEEGIRYPFAARVAGELADIAERAGTSKIALRKALRSTTLLLADDLELRLLTPDHELPESTTGFWPQGTVADPWIGRLREELKRRWLIWHDEEVRAGNTAFESLWGALEARQRAWEDAPHPALDGKTPRDAVDEYELREIEALDGLDDEFEDDDFEDEQEELPF
jgi:hypothetical protein